ncbi:molecular chaperone HtpG [Candidatus Shikimatogenerans silvanidophilus]|uniref:molecular chaperone HtpG n=1 Tax=Candidatus Shikimatogenerans silvanidophilus TaxID=2782547 RepID=UPI001BAC2E08|nr:molecular chaperone HtpG [Candidatus Shikimatogenerans silvanidophilus]
MKKKIRVEAVNIFPIIKNFLYSDNEIFLREMISNANDACLKMKTIYKDIYKDKYEEKFKEEFKIQVKINKKEKTIHIIDNGIGMDKIEIEKYINEIAFSGAEDFIEKYKYKSENTKSIIGHFGLGFYSSFMVSDKVEIYTKSYKDESKGVYWKCEGDPNFFLKEIEKKERGTEIILYINSLNEDFLEEKKIIKILNKYCKFFNIKIEFLGKEKIIINNIYPIWIKKSSELQDNDYIKFYNNLYSPDSPLFWIHLNIDHPFKLTGIIYFPKINNNLIFNKKSNIKLYQNQVFVTDNLDGIVPEFLTFLYGIIDSTDIPLNVSRSSLKIDSSIKKISNYILKKVCDKLKLLFKNNRSFFEKKWDNIKVIIEYGILSNDLFFEESKYFFLFKTINEKYFNFIEFYEKIKVKQIDKFNKIIFLYCTNQEQQYTNIQLAKEKNYEIIILDSPLTHNIIHKFESKYKNISFYRVDSDHIDNIIKKNISQKLEISNEKKEKIKKIFENEILDKKFTIQVENFDKKTDPLLITTPELIIRIKEIKKQQNDTSTYYDKENYNLLINANHSLIKKIVNEENTIKRKILINEALKLAMLSQNLLKGKELKSLISKYFDKLTYLN